MTSQELSEDQGAAAPDFPWPFKRPPMRAWTHAGLLCATAKSPLYGVNGYVRIPEGSPLFGVAYDELDVRVSGGLTYGCYVVEASPEFGIRAQVCDTKETLGWVGFDTQHSWDHWDRETIADLGQRTDLLSPTLFENEALAMVRQLDEQLSIRLGDIARGWTVELVEHETDSLAEQLAALMAPVEPVGGAA